VDGTGSGSCPVSGFYLSSLETLGSPTAIVHKTDLRETGYEDARWTVLLQDHVQWQGLVLVVLEFRFLLSGKRFK
jgi:hypothetical protein